MTIIGENTSKCLQCIKYNNSWRKSTLMWKNVVLNLFSPKIGPFVKVTYRSSH